MAGESPAGGAVKTCGGEGVEAELACAGVDVVSNSLEGLQKSLISSMLWPACSKQSLVDDDAVAPRSSSRWSR